VAAPEFVSLADVLRTSAGAPAPPARPPREARAPQPDLATGLDVEHDAAALGPPPLSSEVREAVREARLFRARLADAFDATAARLLRDLAADVLARELLLRPCDLGALVARALAGTPAARLRVAEADAAVAAPLSVVVDAALAPGDAIVELAGGALDLRLGVRLANVLEALT
jgi:hypothetical protein